MKKACLAALLAAPAALSGCQGSFSSAARERNPGPCPVVMILNDASRFVEFAGDGDALPENVAWSGEMLSVEGTCRYFDDRPIRSQLRFDMAIGRGPAATDRAFDVEYFVAVTRTNRDLIAKEVFSRRVRVPAGRATELTETVSNIVIPRAKSTTSGTNFEILIGFTLTREQAVYNRSDAALKFPEL